MWHMSQDFADLKVLVDLVRVQAVSTASGKRKFSALKIIKNRLRSTMGDEWLNDLLLAYRTRYLIICESNRKKHCGMDIILDMF